MWSRRKMIRSSLAAAGVLGFEGLSARIARAALFEPQANAEPYGPLTPRPSENTGVTVLALPPDFRYTVFGRGGHPMDDGLNAPFAHDGMAAFDVNGELRLVRNHEVTTPGFPISAGPYAYDQLGAGGTTTIVVDPITRLPLRQFVSLSGTVHNCAGGKTPWGTWISCEETTAGIGRGFTKEHGYCYEVPAAANTPVDAVPLKDMGRFLHEAAAVDPETGIVYMTEDSERAGLYRFLPRKPGVLSAGGRLQMLMIRDTNRYDTGTGQTVGQTRPVVWVDIANPDPADAETNPFAVFDQARKQGATKFHRLSGAWFSEGKLFFIAPEGGDRNIGQVWQYRPFSRRPFSVGRQRAANRGHEAQTEGELTLLFESTAPEIMTLPDNVCVSSRGTLVICEDPKTRPAYLRALPPSGQIFDFARNAFAGEESSEFAGATFSPDGQTLFVNLQKLYITVAIWGPWERGPL